ncbi:hypothetical protein [Pseudarthrobacter sp. H2]
MNNPRTTTIIIAGVAIIVGLTVTPLALVVGLPLAVAYWYFYGRRDV